MAPLAAGSPKSPGDQKAQFAQLLLGTCDEKTFESLCLSNDRFVRVATFLSPIATHAWIAVGLLDEDPLAVSAALHNPKTNRKVALRIISRHGSKAASNLLENHAFDVFSHPSLAQYQSPAQFSISTDQPSAALPIIPSALNHTGVSNAK